MSRILRVTRFRSKQPPPRLKMFEMFSNSRLVDTRKRKRNELMGPMRQPRQVQIANGKFMVVYFVVLCKSDRGLEAPL